MRFCMITTFYPPHHFGGDAVGLRRLAEGLARAGHEVVVVCDTDGWRALHDGPEPGPIPRVQNLTVHRLRSRAPLLGALANHQLGRPTLHRAALERVVEGGFDVVHFHNVSLAGGPGLFGLGGAGPVRLVTAHDHWLVCPMSVLWRYDGQACPARRCTRCQIASGRPPALWRERGVVTRNLDVVDAFIAKSAFSRDKHQELGFPRDMEVLPYGLPDSGAVAREPLHSRPFFLFVGRLEPLKGVDWLLCATQGIEGVDLLVAGDGSERGRLRDMAPPHVRFLGRLEEPQLRRLYRDCLGVVIPARGYETFCLVVAEAMRDGAPVLAADRGPLPELVRTSGGGMVFRGARELQEQLGRLRDDPGLRARLGQAGREGFKRLWAEEAVRERYLALVETLRARKRT